MPIKILTISGCSGTGKTQLLRELVERKNHFCHLQGITTRKPRPSDIGEYRYVTEEEFEALKEGNELFNAVTFGGTQYGTRHQDIYKAMDDNRIAVRIITPDYVPLFQTIDLHRVRSLFLLAPPKEVLEQRMVGRGDTVEEIKKRMEEELDWEERAKNNPTYFTFFEPDTPENTLTSVFEYIDSLR